MVGHRHLKPACLPIPALPRLPESKSYYTHGFGECQAKRLPSAKWLSVGFEERDTPKAGGIRREFRSVLLNGGGDQIRVHHRLGGRYGHAHAHGLFLGDKRETAKMIRQDERPLAALGAACDGHAFGKQTPAPGRGFLGIGIVILPQAFRLKPLELGGLVEILIGVGNNCAIGFKFGCKNTSFWGVNGVKVVKRS